MQGSLIVNSRQGKAERLTGPHAQPYSMSREVLPLAVLATNLCAAFSGWFARVYKPSTFFRFWHQPQPKVSSRLSRQRLLTQAAFLRSFFQPRQGSDASDLDRAVLLNTVCFIFSDSFIVLYILLGSLSNGFRVIV